MTFETNKPPAGQEPHQFLQSILDALSSHIAVLNQKGEIIAVNSAWRQFSANNEGSAISSEVGANYLEVCDAANDAWSEEAPIVAQGIREIIAGKNAEFTLEYPCPSLSGEQWFEVRVTRFGSGGEVYLVVAHDNITERRQHQKELERSNRLYAALSHINQAIVRISTREEFFPQVCRILVEQGGFRMAWVGWHVKKTQEIIPIAQWGDESGFLRSVTIYADDRPEGSGPSGRALRTGQPYIIYDIMTDPAAQPWLKQAQQHNIRSNAVFPLRTGGEVCATLSIYSSEEVVFKDREIALLNEAAANISFALDSLKLEELRKQSEAELRQMHEELELRVARRTAQLEKANAALQQEIAEREISEANTRMRTRQQQAVATISQQALLNVDIDTVMQNITDYVSTTMNVETSTLLELMPDGQSFCFRASTGWETDASNFRLPNNIHTHAGYTLLQDNPLIITDLATETRFHPPTYLLQKGIISGVMVTVGGGKHPFGTLAAYAVKSRQFTQDDVYTMQSMAHVLSSTLEQRRITSEINQLNIHLQEVNEELKLRNEEHRRDKEALEESARVLEQAKAEAEQAKESAEAANHTKNEFLSRMSHELRTPLNAILGFGQILDEQELTMLQKESVNYIIKGGRHLLNLINDILDIARIEAGRFDLSIEALALDDIVPVSCALVRPLAIENNIQIRQDISLPRQCHVMADRRQLKQVLLNLLSNAIKYNHPGGKVTISWELTHEGKVRIAVRDTGYGIAKQDMSKLFTPFERLDASNSDVEGAGLGLALSQRLLMAMGSTLSVESELGAGSTFSFELPAATAPEDIAAKLSKPLSKEREPAERQYTVLLIEDNSSNLRLIEMILTSRPEVSLFSAIQGSMGLDLARQHEPDLILLDLHLPDMSGQQILAQLKRSAITKEIPVVVISADATPARIQRLLNEGVAAYLTKPLDVIEFLKVLDETLQIKKPLNPKPRAE